MEKKFLLCATTAFTSRWKSLSKTNKAKFGEVKDTAEITAKEHSEYLKLEKVQEKKKWVENVRSTVDVLRLITKNL